MVPLGAQSRLQWCRITPGCRTSTRAILFAPSWYINVWCKPAYVCLFYSLSVQRCTVRACAHAAMCNIGKYDCDFIAQRASGTYSEALRCVTGQWLMMGLMGYRLGPDNRQVLRSLCARWAAVCSSPCGSFKSPTLQTLHYAAAHTNTDQHEHANTTGRRAEEFKCCKSTDTHRLKLIMERQLALKGCMYFGLAHRLCSGERLSPEKSGVDVF